MPDVATLLSPKHAAQRMNLSPSRLIQLEQQGDLKAIRDSLGRRFYEATEIEACIERRRIRREANLDAAKAAEAVRDAKRDSKGRFTPPVVR